MQLNEIFFAGFVGQDPNDKTTANNLRIVDFNLCSTYKGKNGSKDISTWVRVKVFGGWCDLASKVKKGDNVFVKGSLSINEYEKDGIKKTSVEVIANSLSIIKKDDKDSHQVPKVEEIRLEDIPF